MASEAAVYIGLIWFLNNRKQVVVVDEELSDEAELST
jgi:hypothetical protein